jgi:hypothetical protein
MNAVSSTWSTFTEAPGQGSSQFAQSQLGRLGGCDVSGVSASLTCSGDEREAAACGGTW